MEKKDDMRNRPRFEALFEENIETFNQQVQNGQAPDLRNRNLSGLDLRKAHLKGLDLGGCYLRGSNLRGLDLTGTNLHGASIQDALISGALLPQNVTTEEIQMSLKFGTRIRVSDDAAFREEIRAILLDIRTRLAAVEP